MKLAWCCFIEWRRNQDCLVLSGRYYALRKRADKQFRRSLKTKEGK